MPSSQPSLRGVKSPHSEIGTFGSPLSYGEGVWSMAYSEVLFQMERKFGAWRIQKSSSDGREFGAWRIQKSSSRWEGVWSMAHSEVLSLWERI
jgi:hypothetical protein